MKYEPVITPGFESREEMQQTAIRMRLEGHSKKEIAAALGFKTGGRTLSTWLKDIPAPEWTKRPTAKDDLRALALEMRMQGMSYKEIAQEIGVSKSSLSLWLRGVLLTEEQKERLEGKQSENGRRRAEANRALRVAREEKIRREAAAQIPTIAESELFVAGVVAYRAEGAKQKAWVSSCQVAFANSDPKMILLFLRFLKLLGYERADVSACLAIHESGDERRALRFWSNITGIPKESFLKTILKRHNPKTVRKNTGEAYHGCLTIRVKRSSDFNRRLDGWFHAIVARLPDSAQLDFRFD